MSEEKDDGVEMFVELTIGINTASWVQPEQLPSLANLLSMAGRSNVGFGDTAHLHGHLADGTRFAATIMVDMIRYRGGEVEECTEAPEEIEVEAGPAQIALAEALASKAVH